MQTTADTTGNRQPTHRIYRVSGEGKAAHWTPIGSAWVHRDGKGFSIACNAVPLHGRIVLRVITPRLDSDEGQQ